MGPCFLTDRKMRHLHTLLGEVENCSDCYLHKYLTPGLILLYHIFIGKGNESYSLRLKFSSLFTRVYTLQDLSLELDSLQSRTRKHFLLHYGSQ